MSLSPTEVRVALWEAGYRPLSVKSIRQYDPEDRSQGKAPWGNAWTDRARQNPPGCLSEPYSTDSSNTGILCDGLRAIDLDLEDAECVEKVISLAESILGAFPTLRYRSNSARCLIPYRAQDGSPHKVSISSSTGKIEILGHGQQFVAFGLHPSRDDAGVFGVELEWTKTLYEIPLQDLPAVTEAQLVSFLNQAAPLIGSTNVVELRNGEIHKPLPEYLRNRTASVSTNWGYESHGCEILSRYLSLGSGRHPGLFGFMVSIGMSAVNYGYDLTSSELADYAWGAQCSNRPSSPYSPKDLEVSAQKALREAEGKVTDPVCERPGFRAPGSSPNYRRDDGTMGFERNPDGTFAFDYTSEGGEFTAADDIMETPESSRPPLYVESGELHWTVNQAEQILMQSGYPLYQRAGNLVRIGHTNGGVELKTVNSDDMRVIFNRHIRFIRANKTGDKSIDCPKDIAASYLSQSGAWRVPEIRSIISAPTLRPDGSILEVPGFDAQMGVYLEPNAEYPRIPEEPTREDALKALGKIKSIFREFPFRDSDCPEGTSLSVFLSGMLTAAIRSALPCAPLHAFTAPLARTGKSKLIECISIVVLGYVIPVLAWTWRDEENQKLLATALSDGDLIINLDNCEIPIRGELLCQALTQPVVKFRILGATESRSISNTGMYFANGNALVIEGDMASRSLMSWLDAGVERPDERTFETTDPVKIFKRDRAQLLVDVLTVLRAYHVAGRPDQPATPMGGFEDWSSWVRGCLVWLDEADPCSSIQVIHADDPKDQLLANVMREWPQSLRGTPRSAAQIVELAKTKRNNSDPRESLVLEYPKWYEALSGVCRSRLTGDLDTLMLGKWFGKNKDKPIGGTRIVKVGRTGKLGERWGCVEVNRDMGFGPEYREAA